MAYCSSCGITYPPEKRFCKQCGSPLVEGPFPAVPANTPAVTSSTVQCVSCGATLSAGKKFCPQCGTPLPSVSPVDATARVPIIPAPPPPPAAPSPTQATQRMTLPEFAKTAQDRPAAPLSDFAKTIADRPSPDAPPPSEFAATQIDRPAAKVPEFGATRVDKPVQKVPPPSSRQMDLGMEATRIAPPSLPPPFIPQVSPQPMPFSPQETGAPRRKSKLGLILVLAFVVLMVVAGGGWFMWKRTQAKKQAEQLAQQAQASIPTPLPATPAVTLPAGPDEKLKETWGRMNAIITAIENYKNAKKKLPPSLDSIGKAMEEDAARNDAWGNPFIYLVDTSNQTWVLRSAGPDGTRDTADDIRVADDMVTQWREEHRELLDEWRIANLDLYQKISGEQIASETQAAMERRKAEREKKKAEMAAQLAAQQEAQKKAEEERKKREEATRLAEQQRQQEEARRKAEEDRMARERAEAERKTQLEKMNFVENFDFNLRRWAAASFQAISEKGKPAMRIIGFGVIRDANDWENYTAIFDVKIQKEAVNFIIRAHDRQNFYFLKLTDDKAKLYPKNSLIKYVYAGGKYVAGLASNEAAGATAIVPLSMKIKRNEVVHLTINVSGSTIRTSINGQLVDTWQDNTFKQGAFGFNCSSEEQATLTSFQMRSN